MKLKTILSRHAASRLEHQARILRRALRDHHRRELTTITAIEKRARGLRLYVAWQHKAPTAIPPRDAWTWQAPEGHVMDTASVA
jgi:hypothetical protein